MYVTLAKKRSQQVWINPDFVLAVYPHEEGQTVIVLTVANIGMTGPGLWNFNGLTYVECTESVDSVVRQVGSLE